VALAVAILGVALWGLGRVQDQAHQAAEIDGRMSRLATEVGTQTLLTRRYEKDFFLNIADSNARADYLTKWRQASTALDGAIEAFAAAATTTDDQPQVRQWREVSAQYKQGFSEITRGVEEGRFTTPQAANAGLVPFKDSIRSLTDTLVAIGASKIAIAATAEDVLQKGVASTQWQLLLIGVLALAIAAVWSVVFPMRLMRPITALREATCRLANGDLTALWISLATTSSALWHWPSIK
jgi:methyl-accepting chemotaxis protein